MAPSTSHQEMDGSPFEDSSFKVKLLSCKFAMWLIFIFSAGLKSTRDFRSVQLWAQRFFILLLIKFDIGVLVI